MASLSSSKLPSVYSSNSSDNASSGSNSISNNNRKRPHTTKTERKSGSLSGYSAEREENSAQKAPVLSIDLHGAASRKTHNYEQSACEKRRKTNELQFAASSVKADLARAGVPYPEIEMDKQCTTFPGETICLKNVHLVYSRDMKFPTGSTSVSLKSSISDYEQLLAQCCDLYRSKPRRQVIGKKDSISSDDSESTSSVSDTESDSCHSANGSQAAFVASPLLEDSLGPARHDIAKTANAGFTTCHVVSSHSLSPAVTMSDVLRLCTQPRLVATSSAPYTVVHANAAFARLTGLTSGQTLGQPFSELLSKVDAGAFHNKHHVDLPGYAISSSIGSNHTLPMRQISAGQEKAVDCQIKVLAIVGRKTDVYADVAQVTHFAIDVVEYDNVDGSSSSNVERQMRRNATAEGGNHYLAVGVMG